MEPATYTIAFEQRSGYLYAHVRADRIDPEMALAYLQEVADEAARCAMRRVLINRDIPVTLAIADVQFTTTAALEIVGDLRLAFFNPHIRIAHDIDLAVSVANDLGIRSRLCRDLKDAEWWLFSEGAVESHGAPGLQEPARSGV